MNDSIGAKTKRKIKLKTTAFIVLSIAFSIFAYKTYMKIRRKIRAMDIDGKNIIFLITNE